MKPLNRAQHPALNKIFHKQTRRAIFEVQSFFTRIPITFLKTSQLCGPVLVARGWEAMGQLTIRKRRSSWKLYMKGCCLLHKIGRQYPHIIWTTADEHFDFIPFVQKRLIFFTSVHFVCCLVNAPLHRLANICAIGRPATWQWLLIPRALPCDVFAVCLRSYFH